MDRSQLGDATMLIQTHLDDYFLVRASAKTTQVQYRIAAKLFDTWAMTSGIQSLDEINETCLSKFLKWYETRVGANTVRSKRRTLLAIFGFLGLDLNSRRVRLIRKSPKLIDSWTVDQCQRMIFAATKIKGIAGTLNTSRADYTSCMLAVIYETALRRGDLPSITVGNIRDGAWRHQQSKTGVIVHCRISPMTQQKICSMPHFGCNAPFAGWTKDHLRTLSNLARIAMELAWLSASDGKPLQQLRRSSITIQEADQPGTGYQHAGHTNDSVTKQSYIDTRRTKRNSPAANWMPYVA